MLVLNILNMKNFLQTVNECREAVYLLQPDGSRQDINRQYEIQKKLMAEHSRNGSFQKLKLEIKNPKDYLRVVSYYCGDC